jgi:teichuronic acid biosynthesis glycosyltransferase TuaC
MRVLVVTNAYPNTIDESVGIFVKEQVESLEAIGVDVSLFHVDRTRLGRGVYRKLPAALRAGVAARQPDLVHVMYGGVMAQIVTRVVEDRPVVISFCGNDLLGEGNARLLQRGRGRYGVHASRRAAMRASAVVVKSQGLREALPAGVDAGRVAVLPNGVDLERFAPQSADDCKASLNWSRETKHVLFPAAVHRTEKRFELACAAVEVVRSAGIDVELHVLDRVRRDEVPRWLNASDAVLLTSTHEGSPNVVKEALSCNVSVVSVDVGDVKERIEGIRGCFLADGTAADLGAKLQAAVQEPRPDSRAAAAEISLQRVAERLREIYAKLLSEC